MFWKKKSIMENLTSTIKSTLTVLERYTWQKIVKKIVGGITLIVFSSISLVKNNIKIEHGISFYRNVEVQIIKIKCHQSMSVKWKKKRYVKFHIGRGLFIYIHTFDFFFKSEVHAQSTFESIRTITRIWSFVYLRKIGLYRLTLLQQLVTELITIVIRELRY